MENLIYFLTLITESGGKLLVLKEKKNTDSYKRCSAVGHIHLVQKANPLVRADIISKYKK